MDETLNSSWTEEVSYLNYIQVNLIYPNYSVGKTNTDIVYTLNVIINEYLNLYPQFLRTNWCINIFINP